MAAMTKRGSAAPDRDLGVGLFFGNFVQPAAASGPASCDASGCHPASAKSAMPRHRFDGIVGAAGLEPAMTAEEW